MASGAHVRVEGVRKCFGGVAALADVDLELDPGSPGCWAEMCRATRHGGARRHRRAAHNMRS
jgi:hypothetical protein